MRVKQKMCYRGGTSRVSGDGSLHWDEGAEPQEGLEAKPPEAGNKCACRLQKHTYRNKVVMRKILTT